MLNKFFGRSRSGEPAHPLSSLDGINTLIEQLPPDPQHRLIEAGDTFSEIPELVATLGVPALARALVRLDEATREARETVLLSYCSAGGHGHSANATLETLNTCVGHMLGAYGMFRRYPVPTQVEDKQRQQLALVGARALRLWSLHNRFARFRYRPVSEPSWRYAHDLLATLGQWGVLQSAVVAYEGEPATTPFREYLAGVYLELAPLGNFDPLQVEMLGRFLAAQSAFECTAQPAVLSTHRINLHGTAGLVRHEADSAPGEGAWRFLSHARLRPALLKLDSAVRHSTDVPEWLAALPIKPEQRVAGIAALLAHWAPEPPQRRGSRRGHSDQLLATFGFSLARRFVAASQYARSGRDLRYDVVDPEAMYKAYQLGDALDMTREIPVSPEGVPEPINPFDVLHKLESAGERAMMENWLQTDGSEDGIGIAVPALLPRHVIGALVAVRFADGIEWHLGLIRRIGRDAAGKPNLGVETLSWPSYSATVRLQPGASANWVANLDDGQGWLDAILVSDGGDELVLPAGAYSDGLKLDLRSELGLQPIRLSSLIERGSDFDRVRFVPGT